MPRRQEPFSVVRRPGSPFWYYKLGPWKSYKSSGKTTKADAITVALEALESPAEAPGGPTLRKYVEPFFVWETCPHVKRLVAEGKSITRYHVRDMRSIMENHLLTDPVVNVRLSALKRSHILDYRERLIEKLGYTRTVQNAVGVLKTILKEAYFREDISRDPTVGIGSTRYQPKEIGVFTAEELKKLFPTEPPGPWGDLTGYTVFLMAAMTGMRRGEILALTWECVNFQEKCIEIRQAWKDRHEIGPPKWGKTRVTPIPEQLSEALTRYRAQSSHAKADDLVFCYDDGARIGNTWWAKRFTAAMKKAKIDREKRNIRPHSFRHTLNSILREHGYDAARIRAALGWSTEDVQDGYTHWNADAFNGQRSIVDDVFE
jgi:integrase